MVQWLKICLPKRKKVHQQILGDTGSGPGSKIPYAVRQPSPGTPQLLSLRATASEAKCALEPVLQQKACNEKPQCIYNQCSPRLTADAESPAGSNKDPRQLKYTNTKKEKDLFGSF